MHGLEGVRFMLNAAKYGPLSIYVMASSCVPATDMELLVPRSTPPTWRFCLAAGGCWVWPR